MLPKRLPVLLQAACITGLLAGISTSALAATQERPDDTLRQTLTRAIESSDSFEDRFDAEVWLTDMSSRLASRVKDPGRTANHSQNGSLRGTPCPAPAGAGPRHHQHRKQL